MIVIKTVIKNFLLISQALPTWINNNLKARWQHQKKPHGLHWKNPLSDLNSSLEWFMEGENGGVWTNLKTLQSRHSNFRLGTLLCSLPQEIQQPFQARSLAEVCCTRGLGLAALHCSVCPDPHSNQSQLVPGRSSATAPQSKTTTIIKSY